VKGNKDDFKNVPPTRQREGKKTKREFWVKKSPIGRKRCSKTRKNASPATKRNLLKKKPKQHRRGGEKRKKSFSAAKKKQRKRKKKGHQD